MWVTTQQMRRASRYGQVLQVDSTCKTNSLMYSLVYVATQDGNMQTLTMVTALVRSENDANYRFLFLTALPFLYGCYLRRVSTLISDGDQRIINAIDTGISSMLYGEGKAYRRLCLWHRILHVFQQDYSRYAKTDGGVGRVILMWILHCCYTAEDDRQFGDWWTQLSTWLESRPLTLDFSQSQKAVLLSFVTGVYTDRRFVATCYSRTRSFSTKTTGRAEGENRDLKRFDGINNASSLWQTCNIEQLRQEQREVDRQLLIDYICQVVPQSVASNFEVDPMGSPEASITPAGLKLLSAQMKERKNYTIAKSGEVFIVSRKPDTIQRKEKMPWHREQPQSRAVSVATDVDGCKRLVCSCGFFIEYGIPCRHTLAINGGKILLPDIDVVWLKALAAGHMDDSILGFSSQFDLGPILRRLATDTIADVADATVTVEADPDGTVSLDATDSDTGGEEIVVVKDTSSYQRNLYKFKEILARAGENKDCHAFIEQQLATVSLNLDSYIRSLRPPVEGHHGYVDPIVAPSSGGQPSHKRKKSACEPDSSAASRLNTNDMIDAQGKQKGRKSKQGGK